MVQYSSLPVVKEKDESTTVFMDERNIIKLLSCAEIEHYPKDNHNGDSPFKIVNLEWLFKKKNLVLIGPPQSGKTFLADFICRFALCNEISFRYYSMPYFTQLFANSGIQRNHKKLLKKFEKIRLFILDDFCTFRINRKEANLLLEILKARHSAGTGSTVIITQHTVEVWNEIIEDNAQDIINLIYKNAIEVNLKPIYEVLGEE